MVLIKRHLLASAAGSGRSLFSEATLCPSRPGFRHKERTPAGKYDMRCAMTIVIPTLNRLELAKRALASALAQTIPVEIILSDNGSSDGTDAYFRGMSIPANVRYFHR